MKKNIIISGGGTGGHLFPAIAIAQALQKADNEVNILFVGAKGKIEETKVPEAGYNIELLNIQGFSRKLSFKNITFLIKLFKSLRKSKKIVKKFKPDVVVGVGGYASGALVYVATKRGIPGLIQEQNSYPGITNKILSKRVEKICVAYDGTERFFPKEKIIKTGNPVRETLLNNDITREEAAKFFGLDPNKKIILSLGGSGGAKSINDGIAENIDKLAKTDSQFIWQTGKFYFDEAKKAENTVKSDNIKVFAFIKRMDLAYKVADVVISRAGAGTISELCLLEKPAILVPSPNVAEDHQTKNAKSLVDKQAAILVKDNETKTKLIDTALKLIDNEQEIKILSENISKQAMQNSAEIIAKEVLKLIKQEPKNEACEKSKV